ncbi:MAG: sigma-54 dependent transcriptional regulator [Thermodesulfovibrionales bacterium]|jgi:DNA-binding NtrC family response regulator
MKKILIVDDDNELRLSLGEILINNGFSPALASSGRLAINLFTQERPDAVLLDLNMPDMNGIETMGELKRIDPDIPIVFITGFGDIPTAVETIKQGAYDFIVKPPKYDRLILTLNRAIDKLELEREVKRLSANVETSLEWLLGKSEGMKKVIRQVHGVSWSDFSVIIQGETGTGKSVVAAAIHNLSKRAEKPFVVVDMGAIPETLVESELFGHDKGAFTGAEKKKRGFFEIADGGTLFIDELENMSLYVQSKLLRVVEEKKLIPLGTTTPLDVDVRIIAATNTDLRESVANKKFREDLFFRLGEFIITLPLLKDRAADIPFLARKFIIEASTELNKRIRELSDEVLTLLLRYPWPGNVRELRNVIRRAVLLSDSDVIRPADLDFLIEDREKERGDIPFLPLKELSAIAVKDIEERAITQTLELTKGNKSRAASILQIDYKTLLTKIKEYGIQRIGK